jgi:type III pantothenate kinase
MNTNVNVVIDYGNSAAKVGIFDQQVLTARHVFSQPETLKEFLENFSADHIIVSSVTADARTVSNWALHAKKRFILHHSLPLPITNHYATPETLGVDRLAGVCGAHELFPDQNCLVIDAGTCITFDLIDASGNYWGGSISPGLTMRFQAVNTFTAKLPLVQTVNNPPLIGNSTEACIQSGIINGLWAEVNGIISSYQNKFPQLKVILCGGDTVFFENNLKASIFASPELVLSGLNSILRYNVNQ